MNKIVCLAFTALVAVALAQDAQPAAQPLIPQVATFCKNGCPHISTAAKQICDVFSQTDDAQCATLKTVLQTECDKLCTCVEGCGPSCDEFEANCQKNSLQLVQQFCPFTGGVCDVVCVVGCPQKQIADAMQKLFDDEAKAVQTFIAGLFAKTDSS